ncbi:MAG: gephyrin-like molybdotransferase Glp [Pseudomonadota bacterium]
MRVHINSSGCDCDDAANPHLPALIDVDAARDLALSLVEPLKIFETLPLSQTLGRIAAAPVFAPAAMPAFDNSAMDGFALRAAELAPDRPLPISGCVAAGQSPQPLPPGTAMQIFTGAPLPAGADAVIKIEDIVETNSQITAPGVTPRPGQNIRMAGSDQAKGTRLLLAGQKIAAHHIGLLAALGIEHACVARRPRVGVMSTGNELDRNAPAGARIHDANRPMLLALAHSFGADIIDLGIVPDTADATTNALTKAAERCDLILTSGAVSMGGKDHMRDAVLQAGGRIDGWRVAIKPGKPVMFGRIGSAIVTGLPGNPFAAFVGFHLFAAAQLEKLAGAKPQPLVCVPAQAAFDWQLKAGRAEVFPVRLLGYARSGPPRLERLGQGVSATLYPLSAADGIAMVPRETTRIASGDTLQWYPFTSKGACA